MTEGLKITSKNQVRYVKTTLSSFRHSAYCLKATLRREGRDRAVQTCTGKLKLDTEGVKTVQDGV